MMDLVHERRTGIDRRERATGLFSRHWLIGRRKIGRRDGETSNIYVDRYDAWDWTLVLGVLGLSLLDMVFTLIHLEAGGTEANPVMAWALEWGGHGGFKAVKIVTTVIGLLVLLERLNPVERAVFVLHCAFDYTHAEIGDILGIAETASRQALHRAKAHVAAGRPRFASTRATHERHLNALVASNWRMASTAAVRVAQSERSAGPAVPPDPPDIRQGLPAEFSSAARTSRAEWPRSAAGQSRAAATVLRGSSSTGTGRPGGTALARLPVRDNA